MIRPTCDRRMRASSESGRPHEALRCYRMAAAGHRELRDSLDTLRRMTKGLTPHLELS